MDGLQEVFWMGVGAALVGVVWLVAWLVGWVIDRWQRQMLVMEQEAIQRNVIREALRREQAVVHPWPGKREGTTSKTSSNL